MNILPEYEQFIQQSVETGVFRDRDEVLNEALKLLKQRQTLVAQIAEGLRALEAGNYNVYDDASLRARFDELESRALSHGAADHESR
jgi:putative addiction module CopG family antidote